VSYGTLEGDPTVTVVLGTEGNLDFTWKNKGAGVFNDRVIAVAYDLTTSRASYDTSLAKRSTCKARLPFTSQHSGHDLHIYFAFVSEDRKERSTSQYLGIIQVP